MAGNFTGWAGSEQDRKGNGVHAAQGVLYPYLRGRGLEICPAFEYTSPQLKLKTTGASYGYGYNWFLSVSPGKPPGERKPDWAACGILLFGDAAQVNTWQAPAAPNNPLLEEWYYVDTSKSQPNGHFRHKQRAVAVFCDGHVAVEMADEFVGQSIAEPIRGPVQGRGAGTAVAVILYPRRCRCCEDCRGTSARANGRGAPWWLRPKSLRVGHKTCLSDSRWRAVAIKRQI